MKKYKLITIVILLAAILTLVLINNKNDVQKYNAETAWLELEQIITKQYAYLDNAQFDWSALLVEFKSQALKTKDQQEFLDLAQKLVRHFHDPHLNIGPYDAEDYSVSPTGSDIWASYKNNKFIIEDVKAGAAADIAGILPKDEIITIDTLPVKEAVEAVFGKVFSKLNNAQINHGLNVALGGKGYQSRTIELLRQDLVKSFQIDPSYQAIKTLNQGSPLSFKKIEKIGYIRFNNSLGNSETVTDFAQAMNSLADTNALIIDLRNTPSGGNTGVAEPILGHFVKQKTAYQKYQVQENGTSYQQEKMQTAYTLPTTPFYNKPFVVLAGRWTGSMGEGMTIGLDAIGAANIFGSPMADLLGGIKTVKLTASDTWMEVPYERLYHVNGTYREDFVPHQVVTPADRSVGESDPALAHAITYINAKLIK